MKNITERSPHWLGFECGSHCHCSHCTNSLVRYKNLFKVSLDDVYFKTVKYGNEIH